MGTGYSGSYTNTKGSNTPVSKTGDVRYSHKKTVDYLLNPNHPQGGPKAKFMKDVLGYTQKDAKLFHKNVVSAIQGKTPDKTTTSQYGTKHTYNTELISKSGAKVKANVVVVIQIDNGRTTYKIVTVYPGKKD